MLTLTNSFHSSKTTVRMTKGNMARLVMAADMGDLESARKLRAIKRRLCSSPLCTCSGPTGER